MPRWGRSPIPCERLLVSIAISPASADDIDEISRLVNSAFRGDSSRAGWTTEADLLGGQRTDPDTLRRELSRGQATILCLRDGPKGRIQACLFLDMSKPDEWYLGIMTVLPTAQSGGLGRKLLD